MKGNYFLIYVLSTYISMLALLAVAVLDVCLLACCLTDVMFCASYYIPFSLIEDVVNIFHVAMTVLICSCVLF